VTVTLALLLGGAGPATGADGISAADRAGGRVPCDSKFPGTPATISRWHNPGLVAVSDIELCFLGYISDFDSEDDDDGDGQPDRLGIPHFVIQRIDSRETRLESHKRPSAWMTVESLAVRGIAPRNNAYLFGLKWRRRHADWYERGHLAQKYLLERISETAAWFSHNVVNAVPQRGRFNRTAWLALECRTGAWARKYGTVWVISGPIFDTGSARRWLREPGRPSMPVAIPDRLFKIVVRQKRGGNGYEYAAYMLPQQDSSYAERTWDFTLWSTTVERIEHLTGLKFFQGSTRANRSTDWPLLKDDFDPGCRRFAVTES
jgi:endonuclease G